jgi:hypothetical protein
VTGGGSPNEIGTAFGEGAASSAAIVAIRT